MRNYVDNGVDNSVDIPTLATQRLYRALLEMCRNALRMILIARHSPAVSTFHSP